MREWGLTSVNKNGTKGLSTPEVYQALHGFTVAGFLLRKGECFEWSLVKAQCFSLLWRQKFQCSIFVPGFYLII